MLALGFTAHTVYAQSGAAKLKAVLLFKLFEYVNWPGGTGPASGGAVLCTFGPHYFGEMLNYIASKQSGAYSYSTRVVPSLDAGGGCDVAYVSKSRFDRLGGLPSGHGILIVGDEDGLFQAGGVVMLKETGDKVKLVVDTKNAQKAGLSLSGELLSIADKN